MGRGVVCLTFEEFSDVLRGAKLTVKVEKVAGRREGVTYRPEYVDIDLFNLRVIHVETCHHSGRVEIVLSGQGLPDWSPGHLPFTLQYGLARWAEEPAPCRTRRPFDPEGL